MRTFAAFSCLLSVAMWTADANINVEGTEGGEVSFLCQHKLASSNNKAFCKDPCKGSTDTLATVQPGATVWNGRISLVDWGTGGFTVNISRLQLSDAGTYWCTVDRRLFTTSTAVHLTVKKAVVTVVATVTPDVSPTWTQAETLSSTQLIPDTRGPAHISTTSNWTKTGDDGSSTGTLLYACIAAVTALSVLVCAVSIRKWRKVSKPLAQVCSSSSSSSSSADERVRPKIPPGPPTCACTAADTRPPPIYENISIIRENADSTQSSANAQHDHDIAPRIYIEPLPPRGCEQRQEGSARRHRERSDAEVNVKESKPRTLWFGLDLSGTI